MRGKYKQDPHVRFFFVRNWKQPEPGGQRIIYFPLFFTFSVISGIEIVILYKAIIYYIYKWEVSFIYNAKYLGIPGSSITILNFSLESAFLFANTILIDLYK